MTLPAQDIVERLRERVDRWKLNGDSARVSVPLGELRGVLAEIETYRTAFDGIEPSPRIAALEAEVGRLRAFDGMLAQKLAAYPLGTTFAIEHDGFVGQVCGYYERGDGKGGAVLQQVGTRVIHVYGEKWLRAALANEEAGR